MFHSAVRIWSRNYSLIVRNLALSWSWRVWIFLIQIVLSSFACLCFFLLSPSYTITFSSFLILSFVCFDFLMPIPHDHSSCPLKYYIMNKINGTSCHKHFFIRFRFYMLYNTTKLHPHLILCNVSISFVYLSVHHFSITFNVGELH